MTIDEFDAVWEAFKEGRAIQCRDCVNSGWQAFDLNEWLSCNKLRAKPDPREIWIPEDYIPQWNPGDHFGNYGFDLRYAKSREGCLAHWPAREPVCFREVQEDEK